MTDLQKLTAAHLIALSRLMPRPFDGGEDGDDNEGEEKDSRKWKRERKKELSERSLADLVELTIDLEADNRALRTAAKKGRTLSDEEAKAYDAYLALGKPEEVQAKIKTSEEQAERLTQLEREQTRMAAANALRWDAKALAQLDGGRLEYRTREVEEQVDGKTVKRTVAETKPAGQDGEWKALDGYAKETWAPGLVSGLALAGETTETTTPKVEPPFGGASTTVTRQGVETPEQAAKRLNPDDYSF